MEPLGGAHLDVPEDSYKLVPLRDNLLLLNGPHYVNILKLGDSVLCSHQYTDDTNKRNIFRFLPASNQILHVGKDNTVKTLTPTHHGVYVLGDTLNDSAVRLSFQEAVCLLETLQDSELNWGPDTEDLSQRVAIQLQNRLVELQLLPAKKQPWLDCVLEGSFADLEPLFEDISSQPISDPAQSATLNKMMHRLRYNAQHHLKHPSSSPVVSVSVSPTEEIVVTGSTDGNIAIWDISTTPRLVNTINGLDNLLEVLMGEVLITVHQPNTVIVHQIGEHALSETLFQKTLEGTVLIGATYVSATHKIVLALNVISSPSKANYFLQTASVNLDDNTLELGDRVRVEGSFAALAKAKTHTVSITQDGALAVFDTVSSEIHNFKKPQSNYRFTDVTSGFDHVYATTLAGAILSFNLSTIPRAPTQTQSPSKVSANSSSDPFGDFSAESGANDDGFGGFSAAQGSTDEGFGDFSAAQGDNDDGFGGFSAAQGTDNGFSAQETTNDGFGSFSAPQTTDDGFGGFSAAKSSTDDGFGDFSASQANTDDGFGNFSSPQDDAFGNFSTPQQSGGNQQDDFDSFTAASSPTPSQVVNGTPSKRNSIPPTNDLLDDDFGLGSSSPFSTPPPAASSLPPTTQLSPKFTLDEHPGAAIAGAAAANNNSTGDFGEIPQQASHAETHPNALALSSSKLKKSVDHLTESPAASPFEQNNGLSDLGDFSTGARTSPQLFSQSGTSPTKQSFDPLGEFGSQTFGGNFGDQGDQFGDFGATPQPNGIPIPHPPQKESPEKPKGDLADFSDFSDSPTSAFAQSQSNSNSFGDFSVDQHSNDIGDFGVTATPSSISSSPLPLTPPNLRSAPVNLTSSPTPALNTSSSFRLSSSTLPTSPSIFSQDFGFETPPPVSLAQGSPAPIRQSSSASSGLDAFDDDFGVVPIQQTSPKPVREQGSPAKSPQKDEELIGDFGESAATSQPQGDDFGFGDFAAPATSQNFGNSTDSPQFDDFGHDFTDNKKEPAGGLDDFGATTTQTGDFGEFGGNSAAPHTGDFGETSGTQASAFDDFGETSPAQADNTGDFGESPAANQDDDSFGDFGETVAAPQPSKPLEGDFGEFAAPAEDTTAPAGFGDDDGFGSFDAPAANANDDDFGDFGDFSKPQEGGEDDDFGDFGGFSGAPATTDQGDFGFGDSETFESAPAATPAPVEPTPPPPPVAVPQVPSIFTQEEAQLKETLNETFATAFATLVPPSLNQSSPQSPRRLPADLDLEATLKGQDSTSTLHTPKCATCGVQLRTPDAAMCLACGTPAQGASQFTPWSGLVLPPHAEIKFWDALGVPMRQLTEKLKEAQPAFSSSTGILTPSILTPTVATTPATQTALNSSWDFNENPFAPTATPSASAAASAGPASATNTPARAQNTAPHAQTSAQGFDGTFHSPAATPLNSSSGTSRTSAPSSSTASKSPSLTSTPAATAPPRNKEEEDYFLNFTTSSSLKAPPPKPHAILSSVSASANSPPTHPWSQFLARIPDLSFIIADRLVLPSSSSSSSSSTSS